MEEEWIKFEMEYNDWYENVREPWECYVKNLYSVYGNIYTQYVCLLKRPEPIYPSQNGIYWYRDFHEKLVKKPYCE
jgi:hypothetical protein